MQIFYDKDADLENLKNKKIVVVGYGSQGHAHANNLKDSGISTTVALRKDSSSWDKAVKAGFEVKEVKEAVKEADLVMILMPDELQSSTYTAEINENICVVGDDSQVHLVNRQQIRPQVIPQVIVGGKRQEFQQISSLSLLASLLASFEYTGLIWASIAGYYLFAETIDANIWLGASIIIIGGLIIVLRESGRLKSIEN